MKNSDLNDFISAIEVAAPALATLLGGRLGGVLATVAVDALQAAGVGSDITSPTPASIAPSVASTPLLVVQSTLEMLEKQASEHLNEVTAQPAPAPGAPVTLPRSDAGVEVNTTDNLAKLSVAVVGAIVATISLVSPNTGSFLSQYVPILGGFLATGIGLFLSQRSLFRANVNTQAMRNLTVK